MPDTSWGFVDTDVIETPPLRCPQGLRWGGGRSEPGARISIFPAWKPQLGDPSLVLCKVRALDVITKVPSWSEKFCNPYTCFELSKLSDKHVRSQ